MSKERKLKDNIVLGLAWFFSLISVVILFVILVYIFQNGFSSLSWRMISGDYNSKNVIAQINEERPEDGAIGNFTMPASVKEENEEKVYFSKKLGIALIDSVDKQKSATVKVVYIDPESPLNKSESITAGDEGKILAPYPGMVLKRLKFYDTAGELVTVGPMAQQNAEETVKTIDNKAERYHDYYGQSLGGGIRGSMVTSVILIAITLVIVLPVGICAAIWLNEIAPKTGMTNVVRTGIDMLAGVPSIIFGLMGMTMLYPITAAFGVEGQSILLGGLTMSVVLLPLVIRQTEEALKTVPMAMRSGSLSLGASQTQTIFKVVLPQAMPGIITACLLSISRVIGESAALIYVMGTAISDKPIINRGATTLALHIWKVMSGEQPDFEQATAISIVILVLVLILNFATRFILVRIHESQIGEDMKQKPKKKPAKAIAEQ